MRACAEYNLAWLSKYRSELYGISAILVIVCHMFGAKVDLSFGVSWLSFLNTGAGEIGVDIFLFLSGVSCYYSYSKRPNAYIFLKRRFTRLAPTIVVLVGSFCIYSWLNGSVGWQYLFFNILVVPPLFARSWAHLWFVGLIVILYVIYPYMHEFIYNGGTAKKRFIRLLVLLVIYYLWVWMLHKYDLRLFTNMSEAMGRAAGFMIGCWLGSYVKESCRLPSLVGPAALVIFCLSLFILYPLTGKLWTRFCIYPLFGIVGAIGLSWLLQECCSIRLLHPFNRFLAYCGSISLELYIVHRYLFFNNGPLLDIDGSIVVALAYIALSFAISWLCVKVCSLAQKLADELNRIRNRE